LLLKKTMAKCLFLISGALGVAEFRFAEDPAQFLISTVGFTKLPLASLCPTRSSVNWLAAPLTGF
jgi:hypothetical protein